MKALEAYLEVQLFRRQARGIRLSEAGQDVLPMLQDAFERLGQVGDRLQAHRCAGTLVVSAAPTFAAKWLVPQIETFNEQYPDIEVRIDAAKRVVDFAREDVDVAVRFGTGDEPGLASWPLFDRPDEIFPVCAPQVAAGPPRLSAPGDLAARVLLHADWKHGGRTWPNWPEWLSRAGADNVDGQRGPRFTMWALALQAARNGSGVALGSRSLVTEDLVRGDLVQPFSVTLQAPEKLGFHLVCPESAARRPKVRAFCSWMRARFPSGYT